MDVRPLAGSQTVLRVIGETTANGQEWLRVRLPRRPDGSTGWISDSGVSLSENPWHVVLSRAARTATGYHKGQVRRRFPVIVGGRRRRRRGPPASSS